MYSARTGMRDKSLLSMHSSIYPLQTARNVSGARKRHDDVVATAASAASAAANVLVTVDVVAYVVDVD